MLREIFNANKTSDECHLSFVDDGLLRLIFTSQDEGVDTTYFVVRKADYLYLLTWHELTQYIMTLVLLLME